MRIVVSSSRWTSPVEVSGPAPPESQGRFREDGIDAFRALGALGVIQLHFGPFRGAEWEGTIPGLASLLASFLARIAVPFFFVTSGYLLARRGGPGTLARAAVAQSRRILFLFGAWSLIALSFRGALRAANRTSLAEFMEPFRRLLADFMVTPIDVLLRGPEEHLWFLPALVMGLMLYVALDQRPWLRAIRPGLATLTALVGLAAGSYGAIELPVALNPRSGPFLAFPLVTLGAWIASRPRIEPLAAWTGLGLGLGVAAAEGFWFLRHDGASPVSHNALAGFFLAGPFALAIARNTSGALVRILARAGRLTLGIYAAHTLVAAVVLEGFRRLGAHGYAGLLEVCGFTAIASMSLAIAWALTLIPRTRRLVQ